MEGGGQPIVYSLSHLATVVPNSKSKGTASLELLLYVAACILPRRIIAHWALETLATVFAIFPYTDVSLYGIHGHHQKSLVLDYTNALLYRQGKEKERRDTESRKKKRKRIKEKERNKHEKSLKQALLLQILIHLPRHHITLLVLHLLNRLVRLFLLFLVALQLLPQSLRLVDLCNLAEQRRVGDPQAPQPIGVPVLIEVLVKRPTAHVHKVPADFAGKLDSQSV